MTTVSELAREMRCALDPATFAREKLQFCPDGWQEKVLRSSSRQLILNCTRQAGKSTVTAIIAVHAAVFKPGSLTLLVSRAQRQSAELLAKCQGYIRKIQPQVRLTSDSVLSAKLENGSRIISLPGDGDSIRGFSAVDLLIEDEAAFVSDALYFAVRPMLAVSGGRLMLLSTPHGKIGHFHQAWTEGGDSWERVKITASEVPRISPEFLEQERNTIGDWWMSQEYYCEFRDTDDQLFSTASINAAIDRELVPLELSF